MEDETRKTCFLPLKKRAAVWLKQVARPSWHCPAWLQSIHVDNYDL